MSQPKIDPVSFSNNLSKLTSSDKEEVLRILAKYKIEVALDLDKLNVEVPTDLAIVEPENKIAADTFYVKRKIPTSAADLEHYLLTKQAAKKNWTYSEPTMTPEGTISWTFTDGAHKSGNLNIYKRGKNILLDCDCDAFKSPLNACQHTKLFGLILSNSKSSFAIRSYLKLVLQMPKKPHSVRYYDFDLEKQLVFGDLKAKGTIAARTLDWIPTKKVTLNTPQTKEEILAAAPPNKVPFDYQVTGLQLLQKTGRIILAMPIGSGKTLTSIIGAKLAGHRKILVVAPKSLLSQWGACFKEFASLESKVLLPADVEAWCASDIPVGLITYQSTLRAKDKLNFSLDLLILDEIQNVKNSDTKVWGAISELKSKDIYGLSGTPIENSLEDLYNVMQIIQPDLLGPKWQFQDRYQIMKTAVVGKAIFNGARNIDALLKKLENNLFVCDIDTRPVKTHQNIITVNLSDSDTTESNSYWETAKDLQARALSAENPGQIKLLIQAMLLRARQAATEPALIKKDNSCSVKTIAILDKIQELIQAGKNVCIYSQWTEYLELLQRNTNIPFSYFHGSLSVPQRTQEIEKFTSGKTQIFFCSDAGQTGIDGLQLVCSDIIHCEPTWNPSIINQRTGRLNRIGQTKEVNSYQFVSANTIDSHVLMVASEKEKVKTDVLG